jgi:hypothetical protein
MNVNQPLTLISALLAMMREKAGNLIVVPI